MLFSELRFFAFFAVYLALHFVLPPRFRNYLIIIGGAVFYAWWRIDYIWLPILLTLLSFAGVAWLTASHSRLSQKARLALVVSLILLPLFFAKYSHFIAANLVAVLGLHIGDDQFAALKFGLPLGISFITFSAIAYVVDVYRGRFPAEKNFSVLLAYIMFFPHLIAGPILRPHELIPQFKQMRRAVDARFMTGLGIFTLGLFKKLVIADQLAAIVEPVFQSGNAASAYEYLLAIYAFSAQIYCDFSGYTDMAIGIAYMLRIRLPTNFLRPYTATSVVDFWRRWHITLSHWLRDYLYIPLGGNRLGPTRQSMNVLLTMALGGLWHGANWTFLVWGILHGIALALTHRLKHHVQWMPSALAVFLTFQFITVAWVFFRAPTLTIAGQVLRGPFTASWSPIQEFIQHNLISISLLVLFFATHKFDRHSLIRRLLSRAPWAVSVPLLIFVWVIAFSLSQGNSAKFIYFDF